MASSSRTKTADRQAILKKLLPLLKKQYKVTVPKLDRPVMETMLYAVCLEDSTVEQADAAFARFCQMFPDLNEARVSSISEIEPAFGDLDGNDWRGFRTRAVLQYVFDKTYNFEFESLRKKTLELATKQLAKIKHLSPFVRTYTLQQVIGAHVLPIDPAAARFLTWMGLATSNQPLDEIGESLKSVVRKADAHQFCFSIRCVAADPKLKAAFDPAIYPHPADGHDANSSVERLTSLFKGGLSSIKTAPPAVALSSSAAAKGTKKKTADAKAPVQKPAKVPAAKVSAAKETASKKAPAKKAPKASSAKASSAKAPAAKAKATTKKAKS